MKAIHLRLPPIAASMAISAQNVSKLYEKRAETPSIF